MCLPPWVARALIEQTSGRRDASRLPRPVLLAHLVHPLTTTAKETASR